jgi:exosortase H (IPTLxxWG-CTERM-specific)
MKSKKKKKQASAPRPIKERWLAWYADKGPVLRFGLQFGLLVGLLYALLATPYCEGLLLSYLQVNAWLSHLILNLLGQHTELSGVNISSAQFAIAIRRGCDAVEPTWLYCAAVLCFPAPLKRKLIGMVVGILILQLLNLVRIVTLYWIGVHIPSFFNSAHMEVWPMIFIAVAIVLFLAWRNWSATPSKSDAAA